MGTVDIMGIDILGIDIMGVDILGIDIPAPTLVQFLFFLNLNFKPLAIFCGCTAQFELDLVGNPKYRFSRDTPHICFTEVSIFVSGQKTGI